MLGSHLDSVRRGGRYDGALGVLAALEVVRSVQDAGLDLPVTLEAIDFTDEEGTLVGTLGSWALTGELTAETLAAPRGGRELLVSELARMGLTEQGLLSASRDPATLAGYLELHIEQGPVLERAGIQIGIVTGIIGSSSFHVVFEGEARHAGTTPMDARRDAALGAAAFVLAVREVVTRDFPGCVATVGDIQTEPGSFNVVPGRARSAPGVPLSRPGRARRAGGRSHRAGQSRRRRIRARGRREARWPLGAGAIRWCPCRASSATTLRIARRPARRRIAPARAPSG